MTMTADTSLVMKTGSSLRGLETPVNLAMEPQYMGVHLRTLATPLPNMGAKPSMNFSIWKPAPLT